ncbi:tRNA-dihydrouridine synthase 1, partial [Blastomyces silverae]
MAAPPQPTGKKLFGREFYESLGSPKMILAPMVDRSEFAWRMLTRSFMDSNSPHPLLAYSPMFHARLFKKSPGYRLQHFEAT